MDWKIKNTLPDRVALASFAIEAITVRKESAALAQEVQGRCVHLTERFADPASVGAALKPARDLYHALGIDPSKHRPSSEALLRRVLQGRGLYTVNTAVDAANLASLSFLLPVGLYDADRIEAPDQMVTLRLGEKGEKYAGIGKGEIHVEGRPTLADRSGPFGNPSTDSERTCVTLQTRHLLFVIFAPVSEAETRLKSYAEGARELLLRFLGDPS